MAGGSRCSAIVCSGGKLDQGLTPSLLMRFSCVATFHSAVGVRGYLDGWKYIAITSAVKVLRIDGKLQFDTGYVLKGN